MMNPNESVTLLPHKVCKTFRKKKGVRTPSLLWKLVSAVLFTFKILAF